MKPHLPMRRVYAAVAAAFRSSGDFTPTYCDVRVACNDYLDFTTRTGDYDVKWDYSQDRAFATVRRLLGPKGTP